MSATAHLLLSFPRLRSRSLHLLNRSLTNSAWSTDILGKSASVLVGIPGLNKGEEFELPRGLFAGEDEDNGHVAGDGKISVAMSGGVDSSVTLSLVQQSLSLPSSSITLTCPTTSSPLPHLRLKSNISLSSVFMRNWSPQTNEDSSLNPATVTNHPDTACEWEKDFQDVQQVSYKLGLAKEDIRLVDLSREYWLDVFEPSVEVWEDGGTPNPDVGCNREIKFGALMDKTINGPDQYLATGHYARLLRYHSPQSHASVSSPTITHLHRSSHPLKDQTYYLSSTPSSRLAHAIFPLQGLRKERVRELARLWGLHTADREESMGVCFIGERGRFGDFVSQYTSSSSSDSSLGNIVTPTGRILSTHSGLWHYTIGQRARIGGMNEKWFVADKRKETGEVVVVPGSDHPSLYVTSIQTTLKPPFHWISPSHPPSSIDSPTGLPATCQIRHRMTPVPITIRRVSKTGGDVYEITFNEPLKGVAPGQVVGIWDEEGGRCLGSGVIDDKQRKLLEPL